MEGCTVEINSTSTHAMDIKSPGARVKTVQKPRRTSKLHLGLIWGIWNVSSCVLTFINPSLNGIGWSPVIWGCAHLCKHIISVACIELPLFKYFLSFEMKKRVWRLYIQFSPGTSLVSHLARGAVVVHPALLLLLGGPHPRVCLSGAVPQTYRVCALPEGGAALVVFWVVAMGEHKGLILRTWRGVGGETQVWVVVVAW